MNERPDELSPEEQELLGKHGSLDALREHHADCPRLQTLMAAHAGVLPEDAAKGVARHLDRCGFCQILLRDMSTEQFGAATVEEEKRVRARVFSAVKPEKKVAKQGGTFFAMSFWKAVPVMALAAVALAVVLWVRLHPANTAVTTPATVVRQPDTPVTPSMLVWEKLPIRLEASSILVVRGAPRTDQEKYAAALTSALVPYRDDNYPKAGEELGKVAQAFPRGVEGQLYLGITQLKLQQNKEAIASLSAAQKLGAEQFHDDATWYLALAYRESGDTQSAATELQKLCQGKNGYTERACTGIRELSEKPADSH